MTNENGAASGLGTSFEACGADVTVTDSVVSSDRYLELLDEVESEGAADWTEAELQSFLAEAEAAMVDGSITRAQYWELNGLCG